MGDLGGFCTFFNPNKRILSWHLERMVFYYPYNYYPKEFLKWLFLYGVEVHKNSFLVHFLRRYETLFRWVFWSNSIIQKFPQMEYFWILKKKSCFLQIKMSEVVFSLAVLGRILCPKFWYRKYHFWHFKICIK